jgi:hypothetical protein
VASIVTCSLTLDAETGPSVDRTVLVLAEPSSGLLCYVMLWVARTARETGPMRDARARDASPIEPLTAICLYVNNYV